MNLISSPLRYPGGKSFLTRHFSDVIKDNCLKNITYVEPFAGGAGAALNLLYLEYVNSIWINDADYNIYSFWHSILNKTVDFINLVINTEVNIDNWLRARNVVYDNQNFSILDVGFSTFYLNRCNYSGVINAGPIGGQEQKGKWKIDERFNKNDLIKRIKKISYYNEKIKVTNIDASNLLPTLNDKNYLIYLDPPYYKKGKKLYLNFYTKSDHEQLSNYIHNFLESNWILSYDNIPEILKLYADKRHLFFDINYSVNKKKLGKEVIFYSDNLNIPTLYM
jgi:DNA adenine methylase